ncbi:folylpolyglutamate synthase/dihydrofolate synthase family protein [Ferrovibrio sp.]|uniref:bifunctional folylpolyglutamate synthase/dihydrofolate synthase n=1 Tax=Ferrovibrio sp. TaxID=1917215 RepID=UPI000CB2B131|nr:folylpolyglutamate synthase/dihydrofolate synthase family protein [Ferrovibrio sp.]PJI38998.1 MAG: bifunctional folylpolyglutamate synthase/dihydrofolate synthase [Ferrovibrio sp.]
MAPPAPAPAELDAILQRLTALHPKAIDLSLDRIRALLAKLGDPYLHLPAVFHVAGSKGKGSTTAFLRAMLEAAGYRVHAYTSPHLVRFNERIRLAGQLIDDAKLIALLERCESVNAGAPITFFEITTAAAYLAFAEVPADIVLLETGLGGIADTTNVIPQPLLTALTPIGIDHVAFLGDTITKIAANKAGILKDGVPCVVGPQPDEAIAVIEARAVETKSTLFRHGRDWTVRETLDGIRWRDSAVELSLPRPALLGAHQVVNAGVAIACARQLAGFSISPDAIAAGLRKIDWPARMQRLSKGPLAELLPPGTELWLDGAHNAMAGEALAEALKLLPPRPTWLVAGMLNTKDAAGFLRPLAPQMEAARCIAIPGEANSLSAEDLTAAARSVGLTADPAGSATAAMRQIAQTIRADASSAPAPARVVIAGSLYLAGRILAENS